MNNLNDLPLAPLDGQQLMIAAQHPTRGLVRVPYQDTRRSLFHDVAVLPVVCVIGDSIQGGGNGSFAVSSITGSGTIGTIGITSHGLWPGAEFCIAGGNEKAFIGHYKCRTRVDANTITYDAGHPLPAVGTGTFRVTHQYLVNDRNIMQIANAQLGNPFAKILNGCMTGVTAAYTYATLDELCFSVNPNLVVLQVGTNDIQAGTDEKTLLASIDQIVTKVVERGLPIIVCNLPPWSSTAAGFNSTYNKTLLRFNRLLRQYYHGRANVAVANIFSKMVSNTTSDYKSNTSSDGVHPGWPAAVAAAGEIVTLLQNRVMPSPKVATTLVDRIATDSANYQYYSNQLMNGTGGTAAAGTAPDTWTMAKTGTVTATGSNVARSDGLGNDFHVVCTGAVNNDTVTITGTSLHASAVMGQEVALEMNLRGDTLSGISYIKAWIDIVVDGVSYEICAIRGNGAAVTAAPANFNYQLRTPAGARIPYGTAITTFRPKIEILWNAAGAGNFDVGTVTLDGIITPINWRLAR